MKTQMLPLLGAALVSCAPQAKIVRETGAPAPVASTPAEPAPVEDGPDLLEPSGLLGMPSDREMRATADPDETAAPVIANPARDNPSE